MNASREKIAELYYRSGSVKVGGAYELSAHKDNPELPKSPWYLKYPKDPADPGFSLLPQMFELIGAEFYDICESQPVPIRPRRVTGLPTGALGIGKAWARQYVSYPDNYLEFEKVEHHNGQTEFRGPVEGSYEVGDLLVPAEDHISGGRNNRIFLAFAREQGFTVNNVLAVVDRQQGGRENLALAGVDMLSIFTADALLEYGLVERHISRSEFIEVQDYRAANQLS